MLAVLKVSAIRCLLYLKKVVAIHGCLPLNICHAEGVCTLVAIHGCLLFDVSHAQEGVCTLVAIHGYLLFDVCHAQEGVCTLVAIHGHLLFDVYHAQEGVCTVVAILCTYSANLSCKITMSYWDKKRKQWLTIYSNVIYMFFPIFFLVPW